MKRKRWLAILMGVVLIAALFPAAAAVDAAGADVAEKELGFDFGTGPRSSQDFGNSENSKDSEGSGNSENSEDFEDSGRTENSGNSKDYEGSVGYEDAGWAEESKNFVIYNEKNGYIYAISGLRGTIRCLKDVSGAAGAETSADTIDAALKAEPVGKKAELDVELLSQSADEDFAYGDITSAAISPDGTMLAVALCHMERAKQGRAAIFQCEKDGSLTCIGVAVTGVNPCEIVFDGKNSAVLTADQGSGSSCESLQKSSGSAMKAGGEGFSGGNAGGSVTVIDIDAVKRSALSGGGLPGDSGGASVIVDFSAFDEASLRGKLLREFFPEGRDVSLSDQLLPEDLAISGDAVYVTLKDWNAVALLDLKSKRFTDVITAS